MSDIPDISKSTPSAPVDTLDDLTFQSSSFELLERDFQSVLSELIGDKSLDKFRLEYEKLHRSLKKSHENEKRLIKKCRELNQEIVQNAAKVQTALRLSTEDRNNLALLKREIDKAWKMVDAATERESRARETIQQLKNEIQNLGRLVNEGAGLSIGQENTVNELIKAKQDLTKEVETNTAMLTKQNATIAELNERISVQDRDKSILDQSTRNLKDELAKIKSDLERENRRAERLQDEMKGLKLLNDSKDQIIASRIKKLEEAETIASWDAKIKEEQHRVETYQKSTSDLRIVNSQLESKLNSLTRNEADLLQNKDSSENEIARLNENLREKTESAKSLQRMNDRLTKEKETLNSHKNEVESQRDSLRNELSNIQKEFEAQLRIADNDEKMVKELHIQIKRLNSMLLMSKDDTTAHTTEVIERNKKIEDLEQLVVCHKQEESRLRKENYELEKLREKAVLNASNWHNKHTDIIDQLKLQQMENSELQKKIEDERTRLKTQQALYESVRAERNLFGKQHIESQDEIAEMNRKQNIMTHQIEQLKEEIALKNKDLIDEHIAVKTFNEEIKKLKKQISDKEIILKNADGLLSNQDSEIKNLRSTLQEAEEAQIQQKKVYDDVVNERDILGTQLIRRNDELALLYEKIKIQQSTLNRGEVQYRDRLEDVKLLKKKIDDLKRQVQIRNNEVANVETLKSEMFHLQRELLQERIKVKALSEELENPMNIHRWRKLEGSDPKAFEMLQKIQTLQKRLITKTEEVVEKDLLIQEKEKLYIELKNILARQPGPEIVEDLTRSQQQLKEKQRQMKAMASELNMFQAQVMEYKYEIERLTREMQDLKRKYYEQKRREQLARDAQRAEMSESDPLNKQQAQFHANQARFVGGGFALT